MDDPEIKAILDDALEQADSSATFLHRFLGTSLSVEGETGFLTFPVRKHIINRHGRVHGGILGLAFDMAMGSLHRAVICPALTVEMKIQYLRGSAEGMLRCESVILKKGRTFSTLESKMKNEKGDLIAAAMGTYTPSGMKA